MIIACYLLFIYCFFPITDGEYEYELEQEPDYLAKEKEQVQQKQQRPRSTSTATSSNGKKSCKSSSSPLTPLSHYMNNCDVVLIAITQFIYIINSTSEHRL